MVEVIKITKNEITPFIKNFEKYTPKMIGNGLFEITLYAQEKLRDSIVSGGATKGKPLVWSGNLWIRTRARKLSKNRSVVFTPSYGVKLDRRPRNVFMPFRYGGGRLRSGSLAVRWARTAMNSPFKGVKRLPAGIIVQPRPWIDRPLQLTAKNSIKIMNKELNKVMK